MRNKIIIILTALTALAAMLAFNPLQSCVKASASTAVSPNGRNVVTVGVDAGRPYYLVNVDGRTVIDSSFVSLEFLDGILGANSELLGSEISSFDQTWEQPWGEESTVRNNYNALTLHFRETDSLSRLFDIEFRVFDDGVGFRYLIPAQDGVEHIVLRDENTSFNFGEEAVAW